MSRLLTISRRLAIALVVAWRLGARPTAATPGRSFRSISVLPFESQGGDTANVYFAEGMADELTTGVTPSWTCAAVTAA